MVERLTIAPLPLFRHLRGEFGNQKIWYFHVERIDLVELALVHFMGRPEGIDAGIVDQDIDLAVSKFGGLSRNLAALDAS